jgi:hypothetical protein
VSAAALGAGVEPEGSGEAAARGGDEVPAHQAITRRPREM